MTLPRLFLSLAAAALLVVGVAGAAGTPLKGSVGPSFSISLTDSSGAFVRQLDPGEFTLTVDDKSPDHNFHLSGPGVDVSTEVEEVGQKTFQLNLAVGKYTFVCDPHLDSMRGTFTVGTPAEDPTPTPTPSKPAVKLVLTVTGKAVTLATPAGKAVKTLSTGPVVITVRDKSPLRGATLRGAGANKSTTVKFVGTATWKLTLKAGALVYTSDSRKPVLRGGRVPVS